MNKIFQYLLIFSLAMLAITACAAQDSQPRTHPVIGDQAPNFTLPDIDGKPVSLQDFHGKQVVLLLWNINCPEFLSHLTWFQELSDCGDGKIIKFLTINVLDSPKMVIDYLNKKRYSFPVLFDFKQNILEQYNLHLSTPVTILIGADGKVKNIRLGAFQDEDDLREFVGEGLTSSWDKTPPQISEFKMSGTSLESATLSWKTDRETNCDIEAIRGDVEVAGICLINWTMDHSVNIGDFYQHAGIFDKIEITSTDHCGTAASDVFTLTNYSATNINIYNVKITKITDTSAELYWETDKEATSIANIYIGTSGKKLSQSKEDLHFTTKHTLIVDNLQPFTLYDVYFESGDEHGSFNIYTLWFNTQSANYVDGIKISNINLTDITDTSAKLNWTTDKPIFCGVIGVYEDRSILENPHAGRQPDVNHSWTFSELKPDTEYWVQIVAGRESVSGVFSFRTLKTMDSGVNP